MAVYQLISVKDKSGTKDTRGNILKVIRWKYTYNALAKVKTKRQLIGHKTQHRKLEIEQHELHKT